MRQQFERRTKGHHDRNIDESEVQTTEHVPARDNLKHEMDDILDEIDKVLEENAEEFVKGYIQKGGQ